MGFVTNIRYGLNTGISLSIIDNICNLSFEQVLLTSIKNVDWFVLKVTTEAQLGLIGGTMGLLTGFSILSGVEIIYFVLRFCVF